MNNLQRFHLARIAQCKQILDLYKLSLRANVDLNIVEINKNNKAELRRQGWC